MSIEKDRLEEEVERLSQNLNAVFAKLNAVEERVEELEEELDEARARAEDAEERSSRALATAGQIDDGARSDGGPSKTRLAAIVSRDEVVRRAADTGAGGVKAGEVKTMARGRNVDVDHRLVFNGWDDVVEEWPEFRVEDREDRPKRLVVDADDVSTELAWTVEQSSDADGLTEQFNSRGR
jgi:hypothetical protein